MIRVFSSVFPVPGEQRRMEFAECLRRNLECREIDAVCLLVESGVEAPKLPRVTTRKAAARPTYADFFAWMNEIAGPDDISVLANADIAFDETIGAVRSWPLPPMTALALSRWETRSDGKAVLNDRNDSQDAWVFRGPVNWVRGDFAVGAVRCDNRIARELQLAGYTVLNPAFSIRAWHVHAGGERNYDVANQPDFVEPPYAYVWPHNLWSLPRTLAYNIAHPRNRVGWRADSRRIRSRLKIHRIEKGLRAVLSAAGIHKGSS